MIRLDRSQRSFKLRFEEFYARRVGPALIRRGQSLMRTHQATLDRIEQRFGVPARDPRLHLGARDQLRRRQQRQVLDRRVRSRRWPTTAAARSSSPATCSTRCASSQRGDLTPAQLRGGWAGEIGHTQFLPSGYFKYAVDFDGDGRRDLERSVPDMLASTANFLKGHGWQAGQGWEPGSANYAVIKDWNKAEVYQRTIAVMASRLTAGP